MIDLLAAELNNQFSEILTELLKCIACLNPHDAFSKFNHGKLLRLAEIYSHDFSLCGHILLKDQCSYILLM